jgi:hypothetical protein
MMNNKTLFLIFLTCGLVLLMWMIPPIAQDPHYHHFADNRMLAGIENFWNVLSNLPFVSLGIAGIIKVLANKNKQGFPYYSYLFFFIGSLLTGLGSAYYHWSPSNNTLVWDRLPMTITFMSFLSAIVAERINFRTGVLTLFPLLLIGVASVLYWYIGELHHVGDLRFYAFVQFYPVLMIPMIVILYPDKNYSYRYLLFALLWYVMAKLLEHTDHEVYKVSFLLSGHTFKHLAAAVAVWQIYQLVFESKSRYPSAGVVGLSGSNKVITK